MAAECVLFAEVPKRDRGNGYGQRRENPCPAFLAHHLESDQQDVTRQLCVAAGLACHSSHAASEPREEFFFVAGARNFRVGRPHRGKGMGIASAHSDLLPSLRELRGVAIMLGQHEAVSRFHRGEEILEPFEVLTHTRARQTREHMIDAEKESPFGQVH